jgi:hypothetical protein
MLVSDGGLAHREEPDALHLRKRRKILQLRKGADAATTVRRPNEVGAEKEDSHGTTLPRPD